MTDPYDYEAIKALYSDGYKQTEASEIKFRPKELSLASSFKKKYPNIFSA